MNTRLHLSLLQFLLLAFVFSGCVSTEKKTLKKYGEKPSWASKTPSSPSYYSGVGIIKKQIGDYRKGATRIALDNLINEISVNVASSSLLTTLETDERFNQEFSQNIHLSSKETIEGYELVDTWENDQQYFVYYRLSRTTHKQLKAKRIKLALARAKRTHLSAQVLKQSGNYKQSLVNEIQALEVLNPFLDQNLDTEIDGQTVNLAVHVLEAIKGAENDLVMKPSFTEKNVKVGESIKAKALYVTVTNKAGNTLANIPVVFTHKAISSKRRKTSSNSKGIASFDLGKIKSTKNVQEINVIFDFNSVINESTQNRLIRKIINYQTVNKIKMTLNVSAPSIFVSGKEYLDNEASKSPLSLISNVQKSLLDNNFDVANKSDEADLVLTYEVRSNLLKKVNKLNVITCSGTITVLDHGKLIYSHQLALQKNSHITVAEAIHAAYKKLSSQIRKRVIPEFSSQYFNY